MNFNRDCLKSSSLRRQSLLQRGDVNGVLSAGQVRGEHSFQTATRDRKLPHSRAASTGRSLSSNTKSSFVHSKGCYTAVGFGSSQIPSDRSSLLLWRTCNLVLTAFPIHSLSFLRKTRKTSAGCKTKIPWLLVPETFQLLRHPLP